MITYVIDNLFNSPAQVIVNTVNTVGVMGKGIAKEFKHRYPEMFKKYQILCESKELTVGKLWIYKSETKWILNFPTKTTWKQPSRLEYIENGLQAFVREYVHRGITSIAFPPLGCGNGELNWEYQVKPLMEKYLGTLPIDVFIYFYKNDQGIPEHHEISETIQWLRKDPQSLSFDEVWDDLKTISEELAKKKSLTNNQIFSFFISKNDDDEFVEFTNKQQISKTDLLEFWILLRNYGLIMKRITPPSLTFSYLNLVELFTFLPYCKKVNVTTEYSELDISVGLQIIEPSKPTKKEGQLSLLEL